MWTLNGIRIFVTDEAEEVGQTIARLQPLAGGTVNQVFGYVSPTMRLKCYVVGIEDKDNLMDLTTSGTTMELVGPEGTLGNYLVQSVTMPRLHTVDQTLRLDLGCDAPVYFGDIILLED